MINMNPKKTLLVLIILTLILGTHLTPTKASLYQSKTAQDVLSYIDTLYISLEAKEALAKSLRRGLNQGRVTPQKAFDFLEKIHQSGAQIQEREQVFLIVARTLQSDLPINRMLNKVAEGLARGEPLSTIAFILQGWKQTLQQVKVLLESKNIKVGSKVLTQNKPLSIHLFDPLTEDMAGAMEQFVIKGKDPTNQQLVKRAVIMRLKRDGRIPSALVELIENRVSGGELSKIAVSIGKSNKSEG